MFIRREEGRAAPFEPFVQVHEEGQAGQHFSIGYVVDILPSLVNTTHRPCSVHMRPVHVTWIVAVTPKSPIDANERGALSKRRRKELETALQEWLQDGVVGDPDDIMRENGF